MARDTSNALKNQMIYSVYVRNHTEEGTFKAIEPDLPRIKELGTDIIWFMPIHPIGVDGKKGSLGCPYSIADYREVNPAYGTLDDFKHLTEEIHKLGMKCMIDVVYNHTSRDSKLLSEHPEYFYRTDSGDFGNRCGEWLDVYDLDYENKALWEYQIETLVMWAGIVDGFRCDVASCVPAPFWCQAREAVEKVHPGFIWLAESVDPDMIRMCKRFHLPIWSDSELYAAFDMEYMYDIRPEYYACFDLNKKNSIRRFAEALNKQEVTYPENYNKIRYLENHDVPRIRALVQDEELADIWLAFMFFMHGTPMIYAGQERSDKNTPSLFEYDKVNWDGRDISDKIKMLAEMNKKEIPSDAVFECYVAKGTEGTVIAQYKSRENVLLTGIFPLRGETGEISVKLHDGIYINVLAGGQEIVVNKKICIEKAPLIIK